MGGRLPVALQEFEVAGSTLDLPAREFKHLFEGVSPGRPGATIRTFVRVGLDFVRTGDLVSLRCSIESLIDSPAGSTVGGGD
jgi:hypothetical protein